MQVMHPDESPDGIPPPPLPLLLIDVSSDMVQVHEPCPGTHADAAATHVIGSKLGFADPPIMQVMHPDESPDGIPPPPLPLPLPLCIIDVSSDMLQVHEPCPGTHVDDAAKHEFGSKLEFIAPPIMQAMHPDESPDGIPPPPLPLPLPLPLCINAVMSVMPQVHEPCPGTHVDTPAMHVIGSKRGLIILPIKQAMHPDEGPDGIPPDGIPPDGIPPDGIPLPLPLPPPPPLPLIDVSSDMVQLQLLGPGAHGMGKPMGKPIEVEPEPEPEPEDMEAPHSFGHATPTGGPPLSHM
jgi:hypothetical protein